MTDRRRKRDQAKRLEVLEVGGTPHRLDGHWGRSKTIFDSELFRELTDWINFCIAHANSMPLPAEIDPKEVTVDELVQGVGLTDKQSEVVRLLAAGMSLGQVAIYLGVSKATVQTHRARAWAKFEGAGA